MPTPSIQTLRTDAQQVLNLDSISAVRSVVAATLANANAGTPLNPNLTTQQLWNEFYQIVTQPKSDIESIIANQLMKFMYAPPAPGGAGADKQVIFNDGGVLAGDPQFLWNKTTNLLTVTGSATITGDLTVDTNVLKVNTTTNRVGINTTTPSQNLEITGSGNPLVADGCSAVRLNNTVSGRPAVVGVDDSQNFVIWNVGTEVSETIKFLTGGGNGKEQYRITHGGVFNWYDGSGNTRMTLNATGLNIANGNVILGTSGKGIDFSAVTGGTGTATGNVLNDYEEGTFTPVIVGTTAAGVGTYTSQVGRYTKVGRLVSAQIYLNWTAHTGTGNMLISGLPFSSQNVSDLYNAATFGWVYNISLTAGNVITGYVSYNTPFITLEQYPVGGGLSIPVPIDAAGGFIANVSYIV
jgi:hypothetical protein